MKIKIEKSIQPYFLDTDASSINCTGLVQAENKIFDQGSAVG